MAHFKTIDCTPKEVNFFTNPDYSRDSFSRSWLTRDVPDIDFDPTPIYLQVLNKFDIPVDLTRGTPPGGQLPGIDIKNMDAASAIKFSLAESLVRSQWWEMYEDNNGGVYFEKVFDDGAPGTTVRLDIRLCIPSASKTNEVDMVIVEGYQKPPERYVRPFRDVIPLGTGPINPQELSGNEELFTVAEDVLLNNLCRGKIFATQVYKSYRDPMLDTQFGPQETNPFYDIKAFESLIGYVHRITGIPDDKIAKVKFTFQEKTHWFKELDIPAYVKTNVPACSISDGIGTGTVPNSESIFYYESKLDINNIQFTDKYGFNWPLIDRPLSILFVGNLIDQVIDLTSFTASTASVNFGSLPDSVAYVHSIPELKSVSKWLWDVNPDNSFQLVLYYQAPKTVEEWDAFLAAIALPGSTVYTDGGSFQESKFNSYLSGPSFGSVIGDGGQAYGVINAWAVLQLNRPSLLIEDPNGHALDYAESIRVQFAPIVKKEEPPPLVYYHKDRGLKVVDKSQDLQDNDPTTCQNFEETDFQVMQNLQTGNTIEVSFPFCKDATDCGVVAKTLFTYMSHSKIQTYTINCGPDDEPLLGAHVDGFPTDLRIESISYSYTDGSAYTISVTLGPVFASVGGWGNQLWLRKTTDVSRQAIIIWSAGDGTNYRVNIQGLGQFNAINGTDFLFRAGEITTVTVFNLIQEV